MPELRPEENEWTTDRALLKKVLDYGVPSALQQAVQPIGKLLIQSQVNLLGVSSIAAYNAVSRVDSFAFIPEQGIAAAIATCIAQNRGAGKTERIRKGFRAGLLMELCYGIGIGIVALVFGRQIVSLFVKGDGTLEVIQEGAAYLSVIGFLYVMPGFTNGFQGYCRGAGKIPVTILCTFIQISLRTLGTYLFAGTWGIRGIAAASGVGWAAMLAFEVPYVLHHMRKNEEAAGIR
jgi:Na+-driven multidrug efflux pump